MLINHGKQIITESYYDGVVVSNKTEIEVEQFTSKDYLLKELLDALRVITSGQSRKLTIEIAIDKQGRYKLTQRYVER